MNVRIIDFIHGNYLNSQHNYYLPEIATTFFNKKNQNCLPPKTHSPKSFSWWQVVASNCWLFLIFLKPYHLLYIPLTPTAFRQIFLNKDVLGNCLSQAERGLDFPNEDNWDNFTFIWLRLWYGFNIFTFWIYYSP